jgi:ferric-dicitrate binding protein FerR (iron transport regulator)
VAESPDRIDFQRLRTLIADKCNGAISPADHEELDTLLASSAAARAEYWHTMALHSELEWELAGKEACDDLVARVVLEEAYVDPANSDRRTIAGYPVMRVFALAASLLAILLGGGVLLWMATDGQPVPVHADRKSDQKIPEESPILGRVSPLVPDSRWSFGRPGDRDDTAFRQGNTMALDEGTVELSLLNGTVAVLRAPVVLQGVSMDRVRLLLGRIRVHVAEGAEGFSVETAAAEVVDLGTVFSVGVEKDGTDVIVFDGEVDLQVAEQSNDAGKTNPARSKRFQAGEAVHVSRDGTLSRIVNVNQAEFSSHGSQSKTAPVIEAVRDNIARDDMWRFYEIVPGGMMEDAQAFVDRTHEWNGATIDGIPPYLLGADYVKTFCDDKVTPDLKIELELQEPAAVYVFMDDRLSLPEWVVEQFQDTGDEIGIDESYIERGHDPKVGAGKGIERTFSIWKLVSDTGVVSLGPNGDPSPQERLRGVDAKSGMYGIAAVPLAEVNR